MATLKAEMPVDVTAWSADFSFSQPLPKASSHSSLPSQIISQREFGCNHNLVNPRLATNKVIDSKANIGKSYWIHLSPSQCPLLLIAIGPRLSKHHKFHRLEVHHPIFQNSSLCIELAFDLQILPQTGIGILHQPENIVCIGVMI